MGGHVVSPQTPFPHAYPTANGWGQYEEAIKWCEKAVRQDPDSFLTRLIMTMVYSQSGRLEDARAEAEEVLRINPKFSVDRWEKAVTGSNKEQSIAALRRAGLK